MVVSPLVLGGRVLVRRRRTSRVPPPPRSAATGAAARFPGLVPRLADLQTLQALRVLPYSKERRTFDKIVSSIERYERRATP
jgi:hypothetical protein